MIQRDAPIQFDMPVFFCEDFLGPGWSWLALVKDTTRPVIAETDDLHITNGAKMKI